jgi:hypothetical protein
LLQLLHLLRQDLRQLVDLLQRLRVLGHLNAERVVPDTMSGEWHNLWWLSVRLWLLSERLRTDRLTAVRRDSPRIGLPKWAGSDS